MVDFLIDGNPQVPNLISSSRGEHMPCLFTDYAAELRLREAPGEISIGKDILFFLEITNIGKREWQRIDLDWIRVGCRIYTEQQEDGVPIAEFRQDLSRIIGSGEKIHAFFRIPGDLLLRGRYKLKFDLVNEHQFWFEDLGRKALVEYIEVQS